MDKGENDTFGLVNKENYFSLLLQMTAKNDRYTLYNLFLFFFPLPVFYYGNFYFDILKFMRSFSKSKIFENHFFVKENHLEVNIC